MRTDLKALHDSEPWQWPKSAGRTLLGIVGDSRATQEDRLLAIDLAGDFVVVNDEICKALLKVLRNPAEEEILRAAASISFGAVLEQAGTFGFDDPDDVPIEEKTFLSIQKTLHDIYRDPSEPERLRRAVLEASVRAPEDWHRDAILAEYSSGRKEAVRTAVFCMKYVRGFEPQILEALKNPDETIHFEAVGAAGNWSIAEARDHVVALIEDPSTPKELLLRAIEAVGSIAPREAGTILEHLEESEDEEIAGAVDEAISSAAMMADDDDEYGDHDDDDDEEEDDEAEDPPAWIH
jgi:hypothetical protein